MAYAIVKTGGKQYRVEQGQTLLVERLPEKEGATVALQPLLFRSTDTVFDADGLSKVSVQAKIVAHERGVKLRVFKFKPKRGFKKTAGHRQELTRLQIVSLTAAGAAGSERAASSSSPSPQPGPAPSKAPAEEIEHGS